MIYLISIDDTDDVTKSVSTGMIAELVGKRLEEEGGSVIDGISRHQLLLSENIAYTSHNSAMCIEIEFSSGIYSENDASGYIMEICSGVVKEHMADSADPGVAVCCMDRLRIPDEIIAFGFAAKQRVITKNEAYMLAAGTEGVLLRELGGTGEGVIGALAGIGLRLSRSDGSLRGKPGEELDGTVATAGYICDKFGAEIAVCSDGSIIPPETEVRINRFIKLMYYDGRKCFMVRRLDDGSMQTVHQHQERERMMKITGQAVCGDFVYDNDEEEYIIPAGSSSCFNCLYRRWIDGGFRCMMAPEEDSDAR